MTARFILTVLALALLATPAAAAHWTDNGDGTVHDTDSGLTWTVDPMRGDTLSAPGQCEGLALAGHDDWRLPSAEELEAMLLDPFYNTAVACARGYWSGDREYPDSFHWRTAYVTCSDRGWEAGLSPFPRLVHCVREAGGEAQ